MKIITLFIILFLAMNNISAKVWEVKMLNKSSQKINGKFQTMVFEPDVVFIKKGDSVKFIPTKKGHNVQSLRGKGARPAGSKKWKSKMNKEHTQVFNEAGVHGIECKPHYAMGMVGAVVVENSANLSAFEQNKKIKGRAKKRLKVIISKIKAKK